MKLENTKNDFNQAAGVGAKFYFKNEIPYVSIPKFFLKDNELSLKAKGLLAIIYTLPEEWNYTMPGLAKVANVSEKVLRNILKELIEKKYIQRKRKQDDKYKRFYYEYWIMLEPYFDEFEGWR